MKFHQNISAITFSIIASLLIGINSLLSIIQILNLPSEPQSQVFLGLSASRLLLFLIIGFIGVLSFTAAIDLLGNKKRVSKFVHSRLVKAHHLDLLVGSFLLSILLGWLVLIPGHNFGFYRIHFIRLFPLFRVLFHIAISIFIGISILWIRNNEPTRADFVADFKKEIKLAQFIFVILLLFGILVKITRIGITPLPLHWGEGEPPIFGWQLILALCITGLIYLVVFRFPKIKPRRLDGIIVSVLWIATVLIWTNIRIQRNFFLPNPTPPNFDFYPFSDAATYDTFAHSILIGKGFTNQEFSFRPLYVTFLSFLHYFANNDYSTLIKLQVAIYAAYIPSLYLLGKSIHNRITGILTAILGIFVESNAILASGHFQVVNAQLLLTEFPTAIFLVATAYFSIKWLNEDPPKRLYLVLFAGALGLSMLVRLHTFLILIGVFVVMGIKFQNLKIWMKSAAAILGIVFLIIFPWALRNYLVLGSFSPNPNRLNLLLNDRWEIKINNQTEDDRVNRTIDPKEYGSGYSRPVSLTSKYRSSDDDSQEIIDLIIQHYAHNEVLSILILPISYHAEPIDSYYENTFKFSRNWSGELAGTEIILLTLNVLIVSLGISTAYKRIGTAGFIPVAIQLSYNLSNALVRTSGWRYLKPTNWVVYLYFCIGLVEVLLICKNLLTNTRHPFLEEPDTNLGPKPRKQRISPVLPILAFTAISSLFSFGPMLVSDRYERFDQAELNKIVQGSEVPNALRPTGFSTNKNTNLITLIGRNLYPRFYRANDGISHEKSPFYDLGFSRLEFSLLHETRSPVLIKLDNAPHFFPNGSDTIVLGCRKEKYIEAVAIVLISNDDLFTYISNTAIENICPPNQ